MLHMSRRLRILFRVPGADVHSQTVGGVETLAAVLASHPLELSRRSCRGGAAFYKTHVLFEPAGCEEALAMRTLIVSRALARRHLFIECELSSFHWSRCRPGLPARSW